MAPKEDKSDNDSMNKLNFISNIGQTFGLLLLVLECFLQPCIQLNL
jgi:hypothetical protein